jgi:hypothetical protein
MATQNQIEVKKYFNPEVKKRLNTWEKKFISSLYNWKTDWTEKQKEIFQKIISKYNLYEKKVVEKILYLPMGNAKGASKHQEITTRKMRKNRALPKWKK